MAARYSFKWLTLLLLLLLLLLLILLLLKFVAFIIATLIPVVIIPFDCYSLLVIRCIIGISIPWWQ